MAGRIIRHRVVGHIFWYVFYDEGDRNRIGNQSVFHVMAQCLEFKTFGRALGFGSTV